MWILTQLHVHLNPLGTSMIIQQSLIQIHLFNKGSFFGSYRYGTGDTEGGHSRGGDDWSVPVGRLPSTGPGHHQEAPQTHLFPLPGSRHTGLRGK